MFGLVRSLISPLKVGDIYVLGVCCCVFVGLGFGFADIDWFFGAVEECIGGPFLWLVSNGSDRSEFDYRDLGSGAVSVWFDRG